MPHWLMRYNNNNNNNNSCNLYMRTYPSSENVLRRNILLYTPVVFTTNMKTTLTVHNCPLPREHSLL